MPDLKISELPDAGAPTDTDGYAIERTATSNFRSSWLAIRTALAALFEPSGAVATHDADGAAHGSVESNFISHAVNFANPHNVTVNQDPAPVLGGDLATKGSDVILTRADDTETGRLVAIDAFLGTALIYSDDGLYDSEDGAVVVTPGAAAIQGAQVRLDSLSHLTPGGEQVYATVTGDLYTVEPGPPGWVESDVDAGSYDLGTGTGTGAWVDTGLSIVVPQAVVSGDRLDVTTTLNTVNKSATRGGGMDFGFGINGAQPAASEGSRPVPAGYSGRLTLSFFTLTVDLSISDVVAVWARIDGGSHSQYGVDLIGTVDNHALAVSVPGEGGGGSGTLTTVRKNSGADVSTGRARLNFIEGANITLTIADDGVDGECDITIESTAAGGGGGDMLSPVAAVSVGELYSATTTSGVQTQGAGFAAADVARLSQANTFTDPTQAIQSASEINIDLNQTGVVFESGRWYMAASNGIFGISSRNDAGAAVETDPEFSIAHGNFVGGQGIILGGAAFTGYATLNALNGLYVNGDSVALLTANTFTDKQVIAGGVAESIMVIDNTANVVALRIDTVGNQGRLVAADSGTHGVIASALQVDLTDGSVDLKTPVVCDQTLDVTGIITQGGLRVPDSDQGGATVAEIRHIRTLTQAEYGAIGTPDANTLYIQVG